MTEKWMAKAFANSHGQFKAKAKKAGMSTAAYAAKEAHNPKASTKLKRQANLAKLGAKFGGGHHKGGAHHAHQPHPKTNPGDYDDSAHPPMAHLQENPGEADMHTHPTGPVLGPAHSFKPPKAHNVHGYGHAPHQHHGHHRHSGHPHAHRIGHK